MTLVSPSAQLTLPKGDKSGRSTAVAAVLELVDPLGSGPWLSLTAAAFFFFFFFFFSEHSNYVGAVVGAKLSYKLGVVLGVAGPAAHTRGLCGINADFLLLQEKRECVRDAT
eukprot:FR735547.1.p1 GENE.FR735547.1~~FR735547.1.p1  ORF type:complete len:112 (-),score=30.07 FR735547.1:631-966(-)